MKTRDELTQELREALSKALHRPEHAYITIGQHFRVPTHPAFWSVTLMACSRTNHGSIPDYDKDMSGWCDTPEEALEEALTWVPLVKGSVEVGADPHPNDLAKRYPHGVP